jgi:hypothetical protein
LLTAELLYFWSLGHKKFSYDTYGVQDVEDNKYWGRNKHTEICNTAVDRGNNYLLYYFLPLLYSGLVFMFSSPVALVPLETKHAAQGVTMSVPFQVLTSRFDDDSNRLRSLAMLTGK